MDLSRYQVPWEKICWTCDASLFQFQHTDEVPPLDRFIGQRRAIEAIRFGLAVEKPGYNLFVTGLTGTGKATIIKAHLQHIVEDPTHRKKIAPICDWCYAYNFDDPDRPRVLRLSPGTGRSFRDRLQEMQRALRQEIPKIFKSEEYQSQRRTLEEAHRTTAQQLLEGPEQQAQEASFAVQFSPGGIKVFPLVDNRPMNPEEYQQLEAAQRKTIDEKRNQIMDSVQEVMLKVRDVEKDTANKIGALERVAADERVSMLFQELMHSSRDIADMRQYVTRLIDYVLDNLNLFQEGEATPEAATMPPMMPTPPPTSALARNPFLPFEINVLVDNSGVETVPIVVEANPNWGNLFGRIERRAVMGTYISDHTMLKPGALHLSNGRYLVLNAQDLLLHPGVWGSFKRVLRNKEVNLEDPTQQGFLVTPEGLRPQPIPLEMKVIVTGDETLYRMLSTHDHEDFWDLFKIKAEFDFRIDRTPENLQAYTGFIARTCVDEELLPLDATSVGRVAEYAARLVSHQNKLSSRFGQIKDLLIEADHWAREDGSTCVEGDHVRRAILQKTYRLNLIEERLREMIAEGTFLIDVAGSEVGQVNGLVVYDLGDFSFGRPSRITAQTYAGRRGVINIEREAALSGQTYDKGVLILSGYLGAKYGRQRPLTLSISLGLEQSYEGVDGDSASSAELYAILSSLSDLPIKQGIAVTGSVNQKGIIQPVGGVNQKIEGLFDVCRTLGLTGDQGVMLPPQNIKHLMLRDDVVAAVRSGEFHIYSVSTIDQGMEVLTGCPAGEMQSDGSYAEGTMNYFIERRLRELAESMRSYYGEATPGMPL